MSRINQDTYETFALDYIEGRLSAELCQEMHDFLQQHPDLAEDFQIIEDLTIQPDLQEDFPLKAQLKMDERLDWTEVQDSDLEALEAYRLPEETHIYPYKDQLKKLVIERPKHYLWLRRVAVVAGLALGLSSLYLLLSPQSGELSDQSLASVQGLRADSVLDPSTSPVGQAPVVDLTSLMPEPIAKSSTETPQPSSPPKSAARSSQQALVAQSSPKLVPEPQTSTPIEAPEAERPIMTVPTLDPIMPDYLSYHIDPYPRTIEYVDALYFNIDEPDQKNLRLQNLGDRLVDALGQVSRGIARNYYRRRYEFRQMFSLPERTYELASKK